MAGQQTLTTKRLVLKPMQASDLPDFQRIDADPLSMRYINDGATFNAAQSELRFKERLAVSEHHPRLGYWVGRLKQTGEFIGRFALKPLADNSDDIEMGYGLLPDYWAHGYATEGAKALLRYGFTELGLKEIVAITMPDNKASQKVLAKCGLVNKGMRAYKNWQLSYFSINKAAYEPE